jgi:hypothetical protein
MTLGAGGCAKAQPQMILEGLTASMGDIQYCKEMCCYAHGITALSMVL